MAFGLLVCEITPQWLQRETALIFMTVLYTEITELIKCLPLFLYSDIKALTTFQNSIYVNHFQSFWMLTNETYCGQGILWLLLTAFQVEILKIQTLFWVKELQGHAVILWLFSYCTGQPNINITGILDSMIQNSWATIKAVNFSKCI